MDEQQELNASRERLLNAAESLFISGGFAAVKLKHIAQRLGVKESAIYYHFPKGKEDLFVAVMHRTIERHRTGIADAIAGAGDDWVAQLRAIGHWLVSQPAIDVLRLSKSDLPSLEPNAAQHLEDSIYDAINMPIREVLERAHRSGDAVVDDADLMAGLFVGITAATDVIKAEWNSKSKTEMVDSIVSTLVNGLRRR
jgi:TetR/AcrR family transcriptional regulator, cholesterol catabolism regulator